MNGHSVWKSPKKSHSTMRAKRANILSGQKLIKNAINGPFWRVFENLEACGQTVLPETGYF